MITQKDLRKIDDYLWEIPKSFRQDMRVPARFYEKEGSLSQAFKDKSLEQLINATTIPGIVKYAIAMPDMHEGYGVPIGCVFATEAPGGLISPGAVGYDIGCGVRLLGSEINASEIKPHLEELIQTIYNAVPSGVGRGGKMRLDIASLRNILRNGAQALVEKGYGIKDDLDHIEENGRMASANPQIISQRALVRGKDQLGTLGAGNHFIEIQRVEQIFEPEIAQDFGLFKNQLTFMIHTGSRGLGHQVAGEYIRLMVNSMSKFNLKLPDRELAGAPYKSEEGQKYFGAMSSAANFAFANRQLIAHRIRQSVKNVLSGSGEVKTVYDVAHNMAKIENHRLRQAGKQIGADLIIHRKGATRAFPANHPLVPKDYRKVGQPVLVPGSMGTASYVLVGAEKAMEQTFGSSCHGAGRKMSRHQALKIARGEEVKTKLADKGIIIKAGSFRGIAEEAPFAYKDVDQVVEIVHNAGICKKVAQLVPLAVIKG